MARGLDRYELGALALTAAYNVAVNRRLPESSHLPANLAASAALVGLARVAGVGAADLGLGLDAQRLGVRSGTVAGAAAVAGIAIGCCVPRTRRLFVDPRAADRSGPQLAYEALVRIPFATALGEELVFRGALLGLFGRARSRAAAVAITSSLFGLWHVLPSLDSHVLAPRPDETVALSAPRRGRDAAIVVSAVALTAAAGFGFARLRLRSGSVLAPAIAHAALNASALVAAHLVSRATPPVTRNSLARIRGPRGAAG